MYINIAKAKDLKEFTGLFIGRKAIGSLHDYLTVYHSFVSEDYSAAKETMLYRNHGSDYCSLLEVLHSYYKDHRTEVEQ